ncbi:MAG: hypothetical protein ACRETT_14075 [Steroidobacteraceae bacterium]
MNARSNLLFQRTLVRYYTGELAPEEGGSDGSDDSDVYDGEDGQER